MIDGAEKGKGGQPLEPEEPRGDDNHKNFVEVRAQWRIETREGLKRLAVLITLILAFLLGGRIVIQALLKYL